MTKKGGTATVREVNGNGKLKVQPEAK